MSPAGRRERRPMRTTTNRWLASPHGCGRRSAPPSPPEDVFGQVAVEAAGGLGGAQTSLWRDEGDGTATVVAVAGLTVVVGTRVRTDGDGLIATVLREGRSHAVSDNSVTVGTLAELGRELGITSAGGCPVTLGGGVGGPWGRRPGPPGQRRAADGQ